MPKDKKNNVNIFKAFLVEIRDRWFSSKKRILSTIGVLFIPFIYGFTCIAAYWDPLSKIGNAPISIVSLDKEQLVVRDTDAPIDGKPVALGIPKAWTNDDLSSTPTWTDIDSKYLSSVEEWNTLPDATYIQTQGGSILNYSHTKSNSSAGGASMMSLVDSVMSRWQSNTVKSQGLSFNPNKNTFGININDSFPVNNIKYHSIGNSDGESNWDKDASSLASFNKKDGWNIKNTKDYVQISIPETMTENLVGYFDAAISNKANPDAFLNNIHEEPVDLYLTYEKTFLAPRIINEVGNIFPLLLSGALPLAVSSLAEAVIDDITDKVALIADGTNGGYSWQPKQDITLNNLTWNDHSYKISDQSYGNITETLDSITLSLNKKYTIINEEFREVLISALTSAGDPTDANQLNATNPSDQTHVIPSIEGITNYNGEWNPADDAPDSKNALLHKIKNVSTAFAQIPFVSNAIADVANFIVNFNLEKFADQQGLPYLASINIQPTAIETLLKSDQFISSLLMQDSRYMTLDSRGPEVNVVLGGGSLPIPIETKLEFGRILALMCNTGDFSQHQNTFQQFDLRSAYTKNNMDYETTNVSYHKGNVLNDLSSNDPTKWDYAINSPLLESDVTNDVFSFNSNLKHNYQVILGAVVQTFMKVSVQNYVDYTVIGDQHKEYGIGLGPLFICIGMCVGTISQTMVYDKKKRVRRIKAPKWYMSKSLVLITTSLIQGTILAMSIGCIGWFSIGPTFICEWLFILFSGIIFVCIIQAIWFCFRYRAMGFFFSVIFMVLNLAAGWGTFPAYAQFEFFGAISHVLPFTYMIHIHDAIIYGISTGSHMLENTISIIENIGILLLMAGIFILLGLFMSNRRERELYYGTYNRKHLGIVLKKLGHSNYCKFSRKGVPIVDWKKIPHEEMPKVKAQIQMMFPYETFNKKYQSPETVRDIVDFDNN